MANRKGDTEVFAVGRGKIKLTGYWDEEEIVECKIVIGKRVGGRFAGQTIWLDAGEVNTWLHCAFPGEFGQGAD